MKKFFTLFILLATLTLSAQTEKDPAVFETSIQKISETEYDLIFNITIIDKWHLYSQYNPEDASLPLAISIAKNATGFELLGKAKESKTYKEYSDVWEKEEVFFKDKAKITSL